MSAPAATAGPAFLIDLRALDPAATTPHRDTLAALNARLLEYLGGTPLAPPPWSADPWWAAPALRAHRDAARSVLDDCRGGDVLVLDDPLLAVTLPFWRAACAEIGGGEGVVVLAGWCPADLSGSALDRAGLPVGTFFAVWETYVALALLNARGCQVRLAGPSSASGFAHARTLRWLRTHGLKSAARATRRLDEPRPPEGSALADRATRTDAQRLLEEVLSDVSEGVDLDATRSACVAALSEGERLLDGLAREREATSPESLLAARRALMHSERALSRLRRQKAELDAQVTTASEAVGALEKHAKSLLDRWVKLDDLLGPKDQHVAFLRDLRAAAEERGSWSYWLGNLAVRPVAKCLGFAGRLGDWHAQQRARRGGQPRA